MDSQVAKCCLIFSAFCLVVCVSFCRGEQLPDTKSTDRFSNTREEPSHHSIEKRPTVLLNRLMYALQNAIRPVDNGVMERKREKELERRGYPKHYWKCYFNAVSCFRRKRQISENSWKL